MPPGSARAEASTRLVGREHELEELSLGLADASRGRGGLFLIAGEAGIGKTRLVEALVEQVESTEMRCSWGRCWEGGGGPAYWPWRQVVLACAADTPADALARQMGSGAPDVIQLAPELGQRLPEVAAPDVSSGADARVRFFDAVIGYLLAAAREGLRLVALDDLNAADESSLRLLLALARQVSGSHLLVVGTYRDDEVAASPSRRRLLSQIGRLGHLIPLLGIGEHEVAQLLRAASGPVVSRRLQRQVHEVTNGNPFLTLEAARQLSMGMRPDRVGDASDFVVRRLQELDPDVRELLTRASLLGRDFGLGVLARLDGRPAAALLDELEQAERGGILQRTGLARWCFTHALLRETLSGHLDPSTRVRLHRQAGEAIEELLGETAPLTALAHHFFESATADGGAKALHYCVRGAQAAMEALAFEEGAVLYERALAALQLAPAPEDRQRFDLWMALGEARHRSGELPAARKAYGEALRAARRLGTPMLVASAALGFAGMYGSAQAVDEAEIRVLDEALTGLPDEDSAVRARLLVALAGRRLAGGAPWDQAGILSRLGLDMARRVGEHAAVQAVLWEWHRTAYFVPETLAERIQVAEELVGLAKRTRNREWLIWALEWRAADRFEAGDVPGTMADLEAALREAEDLRLPFLIWGATFPMVAVALLDGRFEEAERLADAALEVGERTEFLAVEMNHLGQLMAIRRQQGRFEELERLTRRHAEKFGWGPTDSRQVLMALVLAELGQLDEARTVFERCAATARDRFSGHGLRRLSFVADVCWLLEDRDRAAVTYAALQPYAGHHVLDGIAAYSLGSSDRSLGQLATLLELWDEAERHFQAARNMHRRLGARVWAAHTEVDECRMLLRRRRPGDGERAGELLRSAYRAYRSLGMTTYLARLDQLSVEVARMRPGGRTERARWVREDDHWVIAYGGTEVHLADSKGMHHLGRLLRDPGRRFSAVELSGGFEGELPAPDPELERARQAVRRALTSSIERVAAAHPALGAHLRTAVRIGTSSSYVPDPRAPVHWED